MPFELQHTHESIKCRNQREADASKLIKKIKYIYIFCVLCRDSKCVCLHQRQASSQMRFRKKKNLATNIHKQLGFVMLCRHGAKEIEDACSMENKS